MAAPRRINVDPRDPDPAVIREAVEALERGERIIFPTDTVYGLAADLRFPEALAALYHLKGRPTDKPIARLIDSTERLTLDGAELTPAIQALADRWWPGGLTLVMSAGEGLTGYRIPDHPVALALLQACGRPLAVTSANPSGEPDARSASEAERYFPSGVYCILDSGPASVQVPSTVAVIDAETLTIAREGCIPGEAVLALWNECS